MIGIGKGIPAIEERKKKITPPMLAIAVKAGPPKTDAPPDDVAGAPDSVAEEGGEDYTAKLMEDITTAGAARGLSPEDAKSFAGDLFDAMAKCLRGGGDDSEISAPPPAMGADGMGEESAA